MKNDIFKGGIRKRQSFLRLAGNLLFKKYKLTLLSLVILALILFFIGRSFAPETERPEIICPEQEKCPEQAFCKNITKIEYKEKTLMNYVCPDGVIASDEQECITRKEIRYVCEDGNIVDDSEECYETVNIMSEYAETKNNVTISIDNIGYSLKGDDWGTITSLTYTILNNGSDNILPYTYVRVYDPDGPRETQLFNRKVIKPEGSLEKGEFFTVEQELYVGFKLNNTITILVRDFLDDNKKILVSTSRKIISG